MRLIPRLTVTLHSPRPPEALAAFLREHIADGSNPGAAFTGRMTGEGFVITRLTRYRSSFLPQIAGSLRPDGGGTEVRLLLRPHWSVFVFMGIWLLFLGIFALIIVVARRQDPSHSLLTLLIPAGIAAGSWLLAVGVFGADARWAIAHFCETVPLLSRRE